MASSPSILALQQALADSFDPLREPPRRRNRSRLEKRPASLAVVIPCRNEEASVAAVVTAFRQALPRARVVVFDNASTDRTAELARAAGAEVMHEARPGKGHVVRRMFADVDADVYLMADGDGTYDAASAPRLVALVTDDGFDMAVGARSDTDGRAHRRGHALGNRVFNTLYRRVFGNDVGDIFSGYRAFSRRFVKSFPALSSGFEIETEMTVHARQLRLPTAELCLPYGKRMEGTSSKLRTIRDGLRILAILLYLLKETRPMLFFGLPAVLTATVAAGLSVPLLDTYVVSGTVPRLPTAVLCSGLGVTSALLAVCGVILDSVARGRAEQKRMLFLAVAQGCRD